MKAEEVKPYERQGSKGEQVEAMFDSIAPAYDFMNTAMTFGMHRRWLKKALQSLDNDKTAAPPTRILDLATGTGEVAFSLAALYPEASILGIDISEGMLGIARKKAESRLSGAQVEFKQGDCLDLDLPDNSFDILTIAYGVRNLENLRKGFSEFHRVLRQGGRCMILELSRPENKLIRLGYDLYSRTLIPVMGRTVSKDTRAYTYLPESIAAMPARRRITEMLHEAGFSEAAYRSLTLGVVTYYTAKK